MTPEVPSVTPTDPGKDTEVVYNYDDQKQRSAISMKRRVKRSRLIMLDG